MKSIRFDYYTGADLLYRMHHKCCATPMEDDKTLSSIHYQNVLQSELLFEPYVNINIGVSMHHQTYTFTVSTTLCVKARKAQICGVMRYSVPLERFEDVPLDDSLLLHFYGMKDGSRLHAVKHSIGVSVENQYGNKSNRVLKEICH